MRLEVSGTKSRVESRTPFFVLVSVEREKVPRARHCPCEVLALIMANGETVRRNSLAHCGVIDDCDRLAAERPKVQVDHRRASGRLGEVVTPVHDDVSSRIGASGILGIDIADAFKEHEVAENERVLRSDHLLQVSLLAIG